MRRSPGAEGIFFSTLPVKLLNSAGSACVPMDRCEYTAWALLGWSSHFRNRHSRGRLHPGGGQQACRGQWHMWKGKAVLFSFFLICFPSLPSPPFLSFPLCPSPCLSLLPSSFFPSHPLFSLPYPCLPLLSFPFLPESQMVGIWGDRSRASILWCSLPKWPGPRNLFPVSHVALGP